LLAEVVRLDRAVYAAVATTESPRLDVAMRRLSNAANYSRIWIAAGALLAVSCGPRGRRAAVSGLVCVASASAVVNLGFKPLGRRRRPERDLHPVVPARQVRMPTSGSFPSGHTASAVAFSAGAAQVLPLAGIPLHALAALVAYSRVHTGVHYPSDVLVGAVIGALVADVAPPVMARIAS
jgi:undecaprenyl-diphosphatase